MVKELTRTFVRVLGKQPEHIQIIIDEAEPQSSGFAGDADAGVSHAAVSSADRHQLNHLGWHALCCCGQHPDHRVFVGQRTLPAER